MGTTTNPFRYFGEYFDEESGLIYLRNRYYSPEIGRFITEDPAKDGLNWYAYCGNNPINFVDPLGLKPTPMEAALMSAHVYNHNWDDDINTRRIYDTDGNYTGWRMIDMFTEGSLKIGVYVRGDGKDFESTYSGSKEYVLAFKGTDFYNLEDWDNNILQYMGEYSEHLYNGLMYTGWFIKEYGDYEISFTGHSKGGGEASANAELWNKNAIVFNPSPPNMNSLLRDEGYVTSYVVKNEILNYLFGNPHIGKTILLKQQYDDGDSGISLKERIENHSIHCVITGLLEAGYN